MESKDEQLWIKLMQIGKRLGCHQKPDRSFFVAGYQFPVCARCTGVIIASIFCVASFGILKISWRKCLIMCLIMFTDWFIQYIRLKESTNIRRFVTGLIGGFGFSHLQCMLLWKFINYILGGIKS